MLHPFQGLFKLVGLSSSRKVRQSESIDGDPEAYEKCSAVPNSNSVMGALS